MTLILDYASKYEYEEGHSHPMKEGTRTYSQLYSFELQRA